MWWRVLRSTHVAVPNDVVCIFSYEYPSEKAKSNWVVKRIGGSARWADFIIRLVVKINSMSARSTDYNRLEKYQVISDLFVIIPVLYKSVNTACAKIHKVLVVFITLDTCSAHPILWQHLAGLIAIEFTSSLFETPIFIVRDGTSQQTQNVESMLV